VTCPWSSRRWICRRGIEAILPKLNEMIEEGLVTTDEVQIAIACPPLELWLLRM